jgi:hypothetical protein
VKTVLHLCADVGSDSFPYSVDPNYEVIKVGKDIGVENYSPYRPIHGIIANPVCTDFSRLHSFNQYKRMPDLTMLRHCQRIIDEASPAWWVIENPASGTMKDYLGKPMAIYQPWEYGSPWTKKTALWGCFTMPNPVFTDWADVPKNENLWIRNGRTKPGLNFQHVSAIHNIPEFAPFVSKVNTDNAFRSLCSQGFAKAFKQVNP